MGERIRRTFGVANFSYAGRTALDLDVVSAAIIRDLGDRTCESFRVSARRADKRFPMTSPQVEREVGGRIQEARGWRVNLDEPALTIHVELLTDQAFYFFGKERGPGGLPTGTAGRVVCLLSGGIDSPVAAHRMMKRGCAVTFVHFHSYPILSRASQEKARELVQLLTKWQHRSQLNLVAFGEIQQQVVLSVPGPMRVVIYRRLMMRIAEAIARERRAQALVTGDVVGQVASQTLENLAVIGSVVTLPVFRPLIGMDKEEITAEATKIGTYPISIIPDQDCCTLFTPRNPLTRARLGEIEAAERALPIDELIARAVNDAIVESSEFPTSTTRLRRCRIESQSRKPRVQSQRRGMTVASTAAVELTVPGIKGISSILGDDARLLEHQCKTIPKDSLLLPGPDYVDRAYGLSDRSPRVLGALQSVLNTGRLAGTGYVSILPVDQGIEHSAGASFAPNPLYFDSENIVKLAIEGGCNAVASTLGVLGSVSRKYAHKIPFILKFNHNEFISYPNTYDQIRFASVKQAFNMGAAGCRRDDLLRIRGIEAADSGSEPRCSRRRTSSGCSPCSGATCEIRRSRPRKWTTMSPPISPGRPITSASRSRPTSSSRRCRRTTAATTRSTSARRTRRSTRS